MRRNFLLGLLICLIPTTLAGVRVGWAFLNESKGQAGFRRGIDLAGGTILVYEVNVERSLKGKKGEDGQQATGLSSDEIKKLAENLKRRIDPADLRNVIVRPVGSTRIEIILPRAGSTSGEKEGNTEDFVQEVMGLVRQVGVLEFRIVANTTDDREGIDEARRTLEKAATDPKTKALIEGGVAELNKVGREKFGQPYAAVGWERERVNMLRSIQSGPFFKKIRGDMVVSLYNQKEIWPVFGYEGESASKGGYIARGFDDIAWL